VAHQEGVIFVVEPFIVGQVIHKQRLKCGITISCWGKPEAAQDAAGIGIDDEYRLPCSVEYYGVRCLLADAVNGEELAAKLPYIEGE
jgi:hypothetical protein